MPICCNYLLTTVLNSKNWCIEKCKQILIVVAMRSNVCFLRICLTSVIFWTSFFLLSYSDLFYFLYLRCKVCYNFYAFFPSWWCEEYSYRNTVLLFVSKYTLIFLHIFYPSFRFYPIKDMIMIKSTIVGHRKCMQTTSCCHTLTLTCIFNIIFSIHENRTDITWKIDSLILQSQ